MSNNPLFQLLRLITLKKNQTLPPDRPHCATSGDSFKLQKYENTIRNWFFYNNKSIEALWQIVFAENLYFIANWLFSGISGDTRASRNPCCTAAPKLVFASDLPTIVRDLGLKNQLRRCGATWFSVALFKKSLLFFAKFWEFASKWEFSDISQVCQILIGKWNQRVPQVRFVPNFCFPT